MLIATLPNNRWLNCSCEHHWLRGCMRTGLVPRAVSASLRQTLPLSSLVRYHLLPGCGYSGEKLITFNALSPNSLFVFSPEAAYPQCHVRPGSCSVGSNEPSEGPGRRTRREVFRRCC